MDDLKNLHGLITAIFQKEPDCIVNVYDGDTFDPNKMIAIISKEDLASKKFTHLYGRKTLDLIVRQDIPFLGPVLHICTKEDKA